MTNKKSTSILTIVASIFLFILTMTQFDKLFELLIPNIENLTLNSTSLGGQFRTEIFFSIVVGLAPIFLYLTWLLVPINTTIKRIFSLIIVLVFMIISIVLRQQIIKSTYSGLINLKTQTGENIYSSLSIDSFYYEYYLLGGLILGCFASYIFIRDKSIY